MTVAEEKKFTFLSVAERLAEELNQGPSRDQSPVSRNLLQSSLDRFLMGSIGSKEQATLLRELANRGNPLHKRSRQTGPQYRRLNSVVGQFLKDTTHTESEQRWILGWAGRLLEVRAKLRRHDRGHGGSTRRRHHPR